MELSDACYTCVHSYYETDESVFCPHCIDCSNYEEITDEDIELFVTELNIKVIEDPSIKELISEPAD